MYVLGTQKNSLLETFLLSTNNMFRLRDKKKSRPLVKECVPKTIFLISQPKHMLWVLIKTVSMINIKLLFLLLNPYIHVQNVCYWYSKERLFKIISLFITQNIFRLKIIIILQSKYLLSKAFGKWGGGGGGNIKLIFLFLNAYIHVQNVCYGYSKEPLEIILLHSHNLLRLWIRNKSSFYT